MPDEHNEELDAFANANATQLFTGEGAQPILNPATGEPMDEAKCMYDPAMEEEGEPVLPCAGELHLYMMDYIELVLCQVHNRARYWTNKHAPMEELLPHEDEWCFTCNPSS